jgi:hypothetical protein
MPPCYMLVLLSRLVWPNTYLILTRFLSVSSRRKQDDNIVWCLSFRHMSSYFKVSRSSFDIVVCWSSTVTRSQFVVQNIHLFILNLTRCWIFLLTRLGWCIYSGVLTATGASSILDTAATTLPGGPISLTCHLACLGTIPAKKKVLVNLFFLRRSFEVDIFKRPDEFSLTIIFTCSLVATAGWPVAAPARGLFSIQSVGKFLAESNTVWPRTKIKFTWFHPSNLLD